MTGDQGRGMFFFSTGYGSRRGANVWRPSTDIYETDEEIVLAFEIPGVRSEDVEIVQHHDRLVVSGVRKPPLADRSKRVHQVEIQCGRFEKEVFLPPHLRGTLVEASLSLGVLSVRISKGTARGSFEHKIEIEG